MLGLAANAVAAAPRSSEGHDTLVLAREALEPEPRAGEVSLQLDPESRRSIVSRGSGRVRDFPLPGRAPVDLELTSFHLLTPRARFVVVDEDGSRDVPTPAVRAFRGTVEGDPGSLVALTFLGDRVAGFIRTWDTEFTVGPEEYNRVRPGANRIVVRLRRDTPDDEPPFDCGGALEPGSTTHGLSRVDPSSILGGSSGAAGLRSLPRAAAAASAPEAIDGSTLLQATIAVDATVEFHDHFGSLTATQDYILNLLAQVSTIYENEVLVKLQVGYLRVFTAEPDPYTDGSTDTSVLLSELRSEWNANQTGVERTVAHLFSPRPSGGSGLAYVDVLCNGSYGYGVDTISANGGSWEKNLVAHEIGHNFSSPHTHCFVPEIDYCANQNGCYQGAPVPSVGTIMSYCGQKQSLFHQRVKDEKIRPAAESAYPSCLTTAGMPGAVGDGSGDGLRLSKPVFCAAEGLSNDDGSLNGYYGYAGTTRMAFIKRLTPGCYPFRLTRLDVLIGHTGSIAAGRPIRLLVYADPGGSGDPGNATLVHSEDTTVQFVSSGAYNQYPLSAPITLSSGDYYLGVFDLEADAPNSYIATRDTSREGDSWQAAESTSPGDYGLHGGATWMIRADGGPVEPGSVRLEWDPACNEGTTPDQDYAVYGGAIGAFSDPGSLTCSTSRATSWLADGAPEGYFIVVPRTSANEGSYGRDGSGAERAPAASPCKPRSIGACP